ncbi:MAG: AAA family ATPase [Collinsella sp.]
MQRQLMSELIAWKSRANRKPLLLRGARQTGKTWLLNEFASQQYRNVIRFDFMLEPSTRSLFDGDLDPKRIISQIELLRGQTVTPADTLIIFDEIQEAPRGITSLKYFNELAPEYHIVAAGSYMGLALRRENESFPVGKIDQLTMRPMGFAEFVRAVDGNPLADAILAADMNLLANVTEKLERLSRNTLLSAVCPKLSPLSPRHATSSKPEGFSSKSSRLTNPILANMHPPASSSA